MYNTAIFKSLITANTHLQLPLNPFTPFKARLITVVPVWPIFRQVKGEKAPVPTLVITSAVVSNPSIHDLYLYIFTVNGSHPNGLLNNSKLEPQRSWEDNNRVPPTHHSNGHNQVTCCHVLWLIYISRHGLESLSGVWISIPIMDTVMIGDPDCNAS